MRHGFTLIELLIVVAIMSIFSATLALSGLMVTQRALLAGQIMAAETELIIAFDAIAGDVAQSTGHAADPQTLVLETANQLIIYTHDDEHLIRLVSDESGSHQQVLVNSLSAVEFGEFPGGLTVALENETTLREQVRKRRWESSVAWPEWVTR